MADVISRKVKIDVDVSEALTGLKAVTREAREATKALRELEEAAKSYGEVTEDSSMDIAVTLARIDKSITDDIRRSYE